jgi:uncharacterized protein GlcG (DUF336 family)
MNLLQTETVSLALARSAIDAAIEAAGSEGVAVGVAVVGAGGELVAYARMDGAPLVAETIARDKAYTAVATGGFPTHGLAGAMEADQPMVIGLTNVDRMMIFGGGVPIVHGGAIVGAVGISGGTGAQDTAVATTAVERTVQRLAGEAA